jgi:hypothetical protein
MLRPLYLLPAPIDEACPRARPDPRPLSAADVVVVDVLPRQHVPVGSRATLELYGPTPRSVRLTLKGSLERGW